MIPGSNPASPPTPDAREPSAPGDAANGAPPNGAPPGGVAPGGVAPGGVAPGGAAGGGAAHGEAGELEGADAGSAASGPDAALAAERDELKDRLLRTLAEMENLRRRTERDVAQARDYAVSAFARDVLGVADNLRRAIEAARASGAPEEGAAKALLDGVELTERDLLKTLERHKVVLIDPHGEKFDPNFHQAMFEAPDAAVPKGHVCQVLQAGFRLADRPLRPALVGVSSGPAANGPAAAPNSAA